MANNVHTPLLGGAGILLSYFISVKDVYNNIVHYTHEMSGGKGAQELLQD